MRADWPSVLCLSVPPTLDKYLYENCVRLAVAGIANVVAAISAIVVSLPGLRTLSGPRIDQEAIARIVPGFCGAGEKGNNV